MIGRWSRAIPKIAAAEVRLNRGSRSASTSVLCASAPPQLRPVGLPGSTRRTPRTEKNGLNRGGAEAQGKTGGGGDRAQSELTLGHGEVRFGGPQYPANSLWGYDRALVARHTKNRRCRSSAESRKPARHHPSVLCASAPPRLRPVFAFSAALRV